MRRQFFFHASLLMSVNPAALRSMYKNLTGDISAGTSQKEKDIDWRIKEMLELGDPDIITDLRDHNPGRPIVYNQFFEQCKTYLENVVETSVDERRHNLYTHLASAMSVNDLLREVSKMCPPETKIPSSQWLRLQFSPKNPTSRASLQFTGKLDVRYQVQSRQFRAEHEDSHYAAAIFRYQKEFAVKFKRYVDFLCSDDKHHIKVGEPGNSVASVERGRRVITANGVKFVVSDHDFTKFSIVPTVTMHLQIPDSIDGSFYRGQVYVGVKDLILEPSSPLRHSTEMFDIMERNEIDKPILFLYTDGGPDHRCTYLSVQLSLLCLFLSRNYDMLVAVRTPPKGSLRNPPERIMSILNLALQCVGLERREMNTQFEKKIRSTNSLKSLRELSNQDETITNGVHDSLKPVKDLLNGLFERLQLKDVPFKTFNPATKEDLESLWKSLSVLGEPIDGKMDQGSLKKELSKRPNLQEFWNHCCFQRQYMFTIKKCGEKNCTICSKPRLPEHIFNDIHILPDPVPGENDHYKTFCELYGSTTTEEYRPSYQSKKNNPQQSSPFPTNSQTANNTKTIISCSECEKPRVLHSPKKLSFSDLEILQGLCEQYSYSCGADLNELKNKDTPVVNNILSKVFVRKFTCCSPVEVPYYSCESFEDICFYCASTAVIMENGFYPFCESCVIKNKKPQKRKRNLWHRKNIK